MNENIEDILFRENIELADIKKRSFAFFVDELLLSLLLMVVLWDSFTQATTVEQVIELTNAFILEYMAMKIMYQTFFVMQYGATLGKILMKIQVIEITTLSHPSFMSSFNRATFRIISEMVFYLGFLWGTFDPLRRTWHDRTAQTLVVNV
jgi:uncharacterized RDD family membrane protein YckC